ncbi:HXXEE domain-containing protein [Neotabrizicola shimadae]|uniref:HXXEE domain-containing protein n=1 Tax=Neotabrizicola shimadae TaxID=2807096 RepID=A0A8G1EDE8_9RHOB|nr:HXXEE domain-containing protein [Neotabrizicola shimadae]QYZ70121.1 HXXEE domain-containing protein [Neotabrizicola shimadae]
MLARLRDNWVYGGFLAGIMLLVLTPVLASDWSWALTLIWLQLPAYMIHQFEEHDADRFRAFVNTVIGGGKEVLTRMDVFIINILGVWGVDAIAFLLAAWVHLGLGLIAVYLSLVNGIIHCLQAIALRRYNPGLVTSILVFIPLGALTLWVLAGNADVTATDHVIGLGLAILIHAAIVVRVVRHKRQLDRADGTARA